MRPVTSADFALEAGVSRATVSHVLNDVGRGRVSDATRSRVLAAADLLAHDGADLATLTHRIADPQTAVVTLTITENGYCLAPDGCLDPEGARGGCHRERPCRRAPCIPPP